MWLLLLLFLPVVCSSPPTAVLEEPPVEMAVAGITVEPEPTLTEETEQGFSGISQEVYDKTLEEVKRFIERLNKIIHDKNYSGWRNALSDELFERYSSQEFLVKASESKLLQQKKIVLKTPRDYFLNVVVPSRANSRVDGIDFITNDRVKAVYIETKTTKDKNNEIQTETRRLRLYELVKYMDTWKIID